MSDARAQALAAIADLGAALQVLRLARANVRASCKRNGGWTEYDERELLRLWPHFTRRELCCIFGRTAGAIKTKYYRDLRGPAGKTAETIARSERDQRRASRATQFKPGNLPASWVPIGSETVDTYGYRKTKVRDGAQPAVYNWEFNHVLLWQRHNGPVPKGHKVVFRNGDKADIRIENLECISHAEMMRRNTRHRYPEEVNRMIVAKAVLTRAINKRQRQ